MLFGGIETNLCELLEVLNLARSVGLQSMEGFTMFIKYTGAKTITEVAEIIKNLEKRS